MSARDFEARSKVSLSLSARNSFSKISFSLFCVRILLTNINRMIIRVILEWIRSGKGDCSSSGISYTFTCTVNCITVITVDKYSLHHRCI